MVLDRAITGFLIRSAQLEDVDGMAKVRVAAWQTAYRGILPDELLDSMTYQAASERWRRIFFEDRSPGVEVLVAENKAKGIVGYSFCGPEESGDPDYRAEIYALYVHPFFQRRGIGRRMIAACARHLTENLHLETLLIWVMAANPNRKFYEHLGGTAVREKIKEIGGQMVPEIGYGWGEIRRLWEFPTGSA